MAIHTGESPVPPGLAAFNGRGPSGSAAPLLPSRQRAPGGRLSDPASTPNRMLHSHHVADLRFLVAVAGIGTVVFALCVIAYQFENQLIAHWDQLKEHHSKWPLIRFGLSVAGGVSFALPLAAAFGAVFAWAYQTGSARLGVVDLFACEINSLCRVATVIDSVRRAVQMYEHAVQEKSPIAMPKFSSEENYFPVFENSGDLKTLEAKVVIKITGFYTYMKAARDAGRALAETCQPEVLRNQLYMLYLALESGRQAIEQLVEYEPERADYIITILISELEAYRFLRNQYPDPADIRHQRLALREPEYRRLIPQLVTSVTEGRAKEVGSGQPDTPPELSQWEPAWCILGELQVRARAALDGEKA